MSAGSVDRAIEVGGMAVAAALVLGIAWKSGACGRLLCKLVGHRWRSPAMEHGADIPDEYKPVAGESPAATVAKFRDYTTLRCARCPARHPVLPS